MAGVRTTGTVRRLAESLAVIGSASDGVFHYYKFGRHEGVFSEKPYFLLSHCAHVLFTLWRFEEEEGSDLFVGQPRPTAFLSNLDFGSLRYNDYKRRVLHADSFEDHWRNETQWFDFWIRILEQWDPSGGAAYQQFARCVLACATRAEVLEKKETHRNQSLFDRFMKADVAGSVMLRTLAVLDEVMRGIASCLAGLDPGTYALERILAVTCLLTETRRIVVCQTPARGPYTPLGATRWRAPSPLGRLFWGRTQGILTVVPRREGGDIICMYDPPPQPRNRKRSWTRAVSSLAGTYEQELFATWPYETGVCRDDAGHPLDATARWTLQNEEAGRLETVSRRIDVLLDGLACNPSWEPLVAEVRSVSRNGNARWKAGDLPWTYIRSVDELLDKLRSVYRQVNALGDSRVAEGVSRGIVPSPQRAGNHEIEPVAPVFSPLDPASQTQQTPAGAPVVADTPRTPEPLECGIGREETRPAVVQTLAVTRQALAQDEPAAPVMRDSPPPQELRTSESPHDVSASAWCAARLPVKRSPQRRPAVRRPRKKKPAAEASGAAESPVQPCPSGEPVARKSPQRQMRRV